MTGNGRLLLVEDDRHVGDVLARGLAGAEHRWIALGPSAMAALEARGLEYAIPEDFCDWGDLVSLCEDLHGRVDQLCEELDKRLLGSEPELERHDIRPFRFHVFPLMILFDTLGSRIYQLRRILDAHPSHTPVIHVRPRQAAGAYDVLFSNDETLWGRALGLMVGDPECEFLQAPEAPRAESWRDSVRRILQSVVGQRMMGSSIALTTLTISLLHKDFAGAMRLPSKRQDGVLLLGGGAEWAHLIPSLRRMGLRVLLAPEGHFGGDHIAVPPDDALDPEIAEELHPLFLVEDVSLYPLLADRLGWIWSTAAPTALHTVGRVTKVLRRHRVRAVLRTSANSGRDHILNQAARNSGVPVCLWQHGMVTNHRGISQFRDFADMMTSDTVLAFGEEPASGYEHSGWRWPKVKVARVGSASLDAIRREVTERPQGSPPRVLYASTNYFGNEWYLGFRPGLSDRRLYRDQRKIISALAEASRMGSCEARVKLHPATDPRWAGELEQGSGVEIVSARLNFTDLLAWSDVVVLDLPSTTLLQALAARRRTFVLLSYWRPSPESEGLLRKAVVARDSADELCSDLALSLKTGVFPAEPDDSTFLRACGTFMDPGSATERASRELAMMLGTAVVVQQPVV